MLSHIFREQVLVILLWIAVFVLVRLSQHKSGRWAKKKNNNNNKQTNKTKPKTKKKKHTKNWCSSGFFFFFFKVFTECAFYAQGANPTNKTTSVNTASFNSFFFFKKTITLTTCFRFVSRKGQQALKTRTVLFCWEKKFPRVRFSS